MKEKLTRFAKNKKYSIPAAILLVAVLIAVNAAGGDKEEFATREAVRASVVQEVDVTGSVKSAQEIDLAFEKSGKLESVRVKVGDKVQAGDRLAELSNADLAARLLSASASLERERIELAELERGARAEETAVSNANLASARTELTNARLSLVDQINSAYAKADDSVRNYADKLFENPDSSASFGVSVTSGGTTYNIDTGDSALKISLNKKRRSVEKILDAWIQLSQSADGDSLIATAKQAESDLVDIQELLNEVAGAVNSLSSTDSGATTVYEGFKSDISTARTNLNAALSSLRSAIQTYNTKRSGLEVAERENTLARASATPEELAIQMSVIRSAQADVDAARAELGKTILVAPVSGTITKVAPSVGEIVSANAAAISIIAEAELQIEVNVPEADIAKIRPQAEAEATFDAYGSDFVAQAVVISVDPSETIIDGVPTYRTILNFVSPDSRIKPGLTTNIIIKGDRRDNVIAIPQRAVITRSGVRIVRVLVNGAPADRSVRLGLRGSDGTVEVLEGLSEGELVITTREADDEN